MSAKAVANAIESVLPARRPIHHHEPLIGVGEINAVHDSLCELGSHAFVKRFEDGLRAACGVEQAVVVSSGTCALQLALLAIGVKPGDEVIVPSLTFAGSANAVCHVGAVPHFIDAGLEGIRPFKLRQYLHRLFGGADGRNRGQRASRLTGNRIAAIIAVHVLGIPCDMPGLREICDKYGIPIIEDAAEALGSTIDGKPCGGFSSCAVLSFNTNKIVTTNGGGAVLTNDAWLASEVWKLATTARVPHPWLVEHDSVAFNYRMGDISAALGLAQLARLDEFIARKRALADAYRRAVSGLGDVELGSGVHDSARASNNWLIPLRIGGEATAAAAMRDAILQQLHDRGIGARRLFTPLHRLNHFQHCPRSDKAMLGADDAWTRTICLPSGAGLHPLP